MKSGVFMKACIILAGLWTLGAAVTVIYFHAVGRPLPEMVVAFLFAPGVGELGFSALIKAAKEKTDADSAESENTDLRAELASAAAEIAEWKAKAQKKKSPATAQEPEAARPAPQIDLGALASALLPALAKLTWRAAGE